LEAPPQVLRRPPVTMPPALRWAPRALGRLAYTARGRVGAAGGPADALPEAS